MKYDNLTKKHQREDRGIYNSIMEGAQSLIDNDATKEEFNEWLLKPSHSHYKFLVDFGNYLLWFQAKDLFKLKEDERKRTPYIIDLL